MRRLFTVVAALLALAPIVSLVRLVDLYGVDVPYHDQWDGELPLFEKLSRGELGVTDLWAPHNEHRIVVPRLIFLALGRVSDWNVRLELAAIVATALLTAVNFFLLLRRTWPGEPRRALLAAFLVNLFVFSPIQHQNWLWGFQIQFLLPALCLSTVCVLPAAWSVRRFALVAAALCVVSTFSLGSGCVVWLASLPLWLERQAPGRRFRATLAWGLGLAACLVLYLHGYAAPENSLARAPAFGQVGYFGDLFFGLLGNPLANAWGKNEFLLAIAFGVAGVTLGVVLVALALFTLERATRLATLGWACLGLYAVLSAGLITIGRAGGGLGTIGVSRYTSLTVYLWIGVLVLGLRLAQRYAAPAAIVLGFAVVAWSVPSARDGQDEMQARFGRMSRGKALLVLAPQFPDQARPDYLGQPKLSLVEKSLRLSQLGFLRPAAIRSRAIADVARLTTTSCGAIEEAYPERRRVRLLGYALLPDPRLPDAVLLTYRRRDHAAMVFAWATEAGRSRPELAAALDCPECLEAGWEDTFRLPDRELPAIVEAWAYDVRHGTACPLEGSYRVEK